MIWVLYQKDDWGMLGTFERNGALSAAPEIIACLTFPLVFLFLLHFYLIVLSVIAVGAEALVLFQASSRDLWWTKWHCDWLLSKYFCFELSVPFHQIFILMFLYIRLFVRRMSGRNLGALEKTVLFSGGGVLEIKSVFLLNRSAKG
jgi:hypothetical protein